jgi:hypothetical protein
MSRRFCGARSLGRIARIGGPRSMTGRPSVLVLPLFVGRVGVRRVVSSGDTRAVRSCAARSPTRPLGVLFLLQRSCLASGARSVAHNRPLALGLCAPMVPRDGPPFPASSAFAAAAIPRRAVAAIPRCDAGGGRHPSDRVYGHHRRGAKRTASSAQGQAGSGSRGMSAAANGHNDGSPGGRAGRGYRRGATWVCSGQALRSTARRASPRRR